MLKNKLLLGLILTGCFSGYALATPGPSLNKTLPVSLNQETKLTVDWAGSSSFYLDMMTIIGAPIGTLTISSTGLSSITVKSPESESAGHSGSIAFTGKGSADKAYLIALGTPSNGVISKDVAGGMTYTPPAGSTTMPASFNIAYSPKSASSYRTAGTYTANIVVESIVA